MGRQTPREGGWMQISPINPPLNFEKILSFSAPKAVRFSNFKGNGDSDSPWYWEKRACFDTVIITVAVEERVNFSNCIDYQILRLLFQTDTYSLIKAVHTIQRVNSFHVYWNSDKVTVSNNRCIESTVYWTHFSLPPSTDLFPHSRSEYGRGRPRFLLECFATHFRLGVGTHFPPSLPREIAWRSHFMAAHFSNSSVEVIFLHLATYSE